MATLLEQSVDESPRNSPLRVVVFLRESSEQYNNLIAPYGGISKARDHWDEVVKAAHQTLMGDPNFSSHVMQQALLLAVQNMPHLAIFAFDVDYDSYDWETAHEQQPVDMPMVIVKFNEMSTTVSQVGEDLRRRVNKHVAEEHRLNGWTVGPPYFQDQSRERPGAPSYPTTRSLRPRPQGFEPTIQKLRLT